MRRVNAIILLVIGIVFTFQNCSKESEGTNYLYSYGTYYESSESSLGFIFDLDNGKTLIPSAASGIPSEVKDSSRFMIEYIKKGETDESIDGEITGTQSILTKYILQLTPENEDSIGNDGVILTEEYIWFSNHHINMMFSYYGNNIKHYINLVKPIGKQEDEHGNQILELRHNANDDLHSAELSALVSFDMMSIYEPGMDSINIAIKWVGYYSDTNTMESTFYFNQQNNQKSASIQQLLNNKIY